MNVNKKVFAIFVSFFTLILTASVGYSYTITASSSSGGSISPAGAVTVTAGADQTFTITPDFNNRVLDVDVDGVPEGPTLSYTFTNVTADYTIEASFDVCDYSFPVLLEGFGYYDSIMTAYDDAFVSGLNAITLLLMEGALAHENLNFDADILVRLDGGYDCSFLSSTLATQISGSLTIAAGTVIPSGLGLSSSPLCEPGDPDNFPGNPEICDGLDNNCNGIADDGLGIDADSDGHYTFDTCATFTPRDDCDDSDPNNFPGNPEICDSLDNNCDDQADEGLVPIDADGDGYTSLDSCGGSADDCNDNDADINPNGIEIFGDGIDQNCDGYDIRPAEQTCFTAGSCHSVAGVDQLHASVPAPEPACIPCHRVREASVRTGHYGETVRTPGNNMLAGEEIRCVSCHDWHDPEFYTIPGAYFVWAKVHAVGRFNVTCFTCHENHPVDHLTGNAHDNRVIDPSCASCHTSDTTVLGSPGTGTLTSDEDVYALHRSDCYLCHAYEGTKLDPIIVDQMIINGLYGNLITCIDCHMDKGTGHGSVDHVALGYVTLGATSCTSCHDPGGAANATVALTHNGNCALCHTTVPDLQPGIPAGGGDCTTCHTSTWEALHPTAPDHSSLVTVGTTDCASCHSDTPFIDPADAKVHNGCSSCHNSTTGALVSSAIGKTFATGGDCATCHTDPFDSLHAGHAHTVEVGSSDLSYDPPGTLCSSCHVVANWAEIEGTEHNVATNGAGSCSTCHNSARQEVNDAIALGANPTNCLDCHSNKQLTVHGTVDHVALDYVTLGATSCTSCHDPGGAANATVNITHNGNCALCHTTVPDLQPGIPAGGGDCSTCHTDTWENTHTTNPPYHSSLVTVVGTIGCASCHSDPPPLVDPADAKVHNGCSSCHNTTTGALVSFAIGKTFATGGDCATCHIDTFETIHPATVDHSGYIVTTGPACVGCHDSTNNALVDAADPRAHNGCTSCHDAEGSLIGSAVPGGGDCQTCHTEMTQYYMHNKGSGWNMRHYEAGGYFRTEQIDATSCATCHIDIQPGEYPEGSDPLVVLKYEVIQTHGGSCEACHTENGLFGSAANNPSGGICWTCHTGYDVSFQNHNPPTHAALTETATCTACHTGPDMIVDTHNNNCLNCHTDLTTGILRSGSNGDSTGGAGECIDCHGSDFPGIHPATIDHTALVTVGTTGCADCHNDPPPLVNPADAKVHNACSSCHDANGVLVNSAIGKSFAVGGDCATCHIDPFDTLHAGRAHTVELDINNDLSNGTSCGSCHVVANWTGIEGTEHNVATNGAGSCATCHNSPRQEVIDAIALGANPTNCLDCHSDKTAAHGSIDHVASGYVTLGSTSCADCHDPGGAENATVDVTHNGDCALCHTTVPNLQPGVPAGGGDCYDCHGSDVQSVHPSCTTCHGEPPSGTSSPNTEGAHTEHDALGYGSVSPSCNACHNNAAHYNGTTNVNIPSSFNAQSGSATYSSSNNTCSSNRCHGGQTTPNWSTGSINVNTQCTSCHDARDRGTIPDQYNDYDSGEHDKHVRGEGFACTVCHNTSKLATGHFTNLQTSGFEQDPASTIGGGTTDVPNGYNGTCNFYCHGENHRFERW